MTCGISVLSNAVSGNAAAQQTPPADASKAPAAKTPAAKTPPATTGKAGAAKSRTLPGAKSSSAFTLKTARDKRSYAVGLNIGKGLHPEVLDVDTAILLRGLKDGLAGGKTLLTDEEARAVLTALQNDMRKKQEGQMQAAGDANKKQGEAFLAANKAKEGVVTLPSGLQYKILKQGRGPKPAATDTVVCNYKGTLLDNTEFDSSYKRGQPASFGVNKVIPGWTEALQLMPVGSKWQLFIPSGLAYGERGPGGGIGPNSTLIFEVELISIQGK
ncbi:MAG: FKBP-type peptidyl-prolyl cis-trans isomerase [Acidipila sp.]|nr:FKBP-type peptidyl-prolyl cis-trans isomerase [Acidipila sp.]